MLPDNFDTKHVLTISRYKGSVILKEDCAKNFCTFFIIVNKLLWYPIKVHIYTDNDTYRIQLWV